MPVAPTFVSCVSENHLPRLKFDSVIDAHLRLQILLHPQGIAIPDSFIFSDAIRTNLENADPWLLHAMQAKLVTVLCRFAYSNTNAKYDT